MREWAIRESVAELRSRCIYIYIIMQREST